MSHEENGKNHNKKQKNGDLAHNESSCALQESRTILCKYKYATACIWMRHEKKEKSHGTSKQMRLK